MSDKEPETNWIIATLKKEWPSLKKFLVHLACITFGAVCISVLYEKFIIPGKDSTIGALQQEKEKLSNDLQREDRENDKLRNEVATYQSAHDEKSFPLKKRAQILARQINEFADAVKKGSIDLGQRQNEWNNRFEPRITVILSQLDQLGQHSEKLEQTENVFAFQNEFPTVAKDIATEINKLADGLPDSESP
jgi:hypothetical protein